MSSSNGFADQERETPASVNHDNSDNTRVPDALYPCNACNHLHMKAATNPNQIAHHVQEARRGSQSAFHWLHHTFAPLVHSIHLGMTSRAQAEELTQETFVIAFGKLEQLRQPTHFGPWIAMIARRNRPSESLETSDLSASGDVAWPGSGPDTRFNARQALHAIQQLPESYREPLILRLVEGLSGPEIAAMTGLTPQSVRVNLHRGMAKLRLALGIAKQAEESIDG